MAGGLEQAEVVREVDHRSDRRAGGEEHDFECELLGVCEGTALDAVGALEHWRLLVLALGSKL